MGHSFGTRCLRDGERRHDEDGDQVAHHSVRVPEAQEVGDRELAEGTERLGDEDRGQRKAPDGPAKEGPRPCAMAYRED